MSEEEIESPEWDPTAPMVVVLDVGAGRGTRKPFIRLLVTVDSAEDKTAAIGKATSKVMTDPIGSQLWWGWSIVPARVLPVGHETLSRHGEYLAYTIPIKGSSVTYLQGPEVYNYAMLHGPIRELVLSSLTPALPDGD